MLLNFKKNKTRVLITSEYSWLKDRQGTLVELSPRTIMKLVSEGQTAITYGVDFGKCFKGHTGDSTPTATHDLFGTLKTNTGFFFLDHEFILLPD